MTILEKLSNVALAEIYNLASPTPVTRFSDRAAALRRVDRVLAADMTGRVLVVEADGSWTYVVPTTPIEPPAERESIHRFARIRVLAETNPKQQGSGAAARFAIYRNGMTADEYIDAAMAGGHTRAAARSDLRHDSRHGWISVG